MFGLGPLEILLILFVILFFTGGKKLPEIGKGIGKGIGEFKRALRGSSPSPDGKEPENTK